MEYIQWNKQQTQQTLTYPLWPPPSATQFLLVQFFFAIHLPFCMVHRTHNYCKCARERMCVHV